MALTLFKVAVSGQEIQSKASPDKDSKPKSLQARADAIRKASENQTAEEFLGNPPEAKLL